MHFNRLRDAISDMDAFLIDTERDAISDRDAFLTETRQRCNFRHECNFNRHDKETR